MDSDIDIILNKPDLNMTVL